jgi:ATP-dependent Clp protease adaptor protein ClpS.
MKNYPDIQGQEIEDVLTEVTAPFHLIVWNDEVNTFEWVIETLMEVCNHSYEQAEQCATSFITKENIQLKMEHMST